MVHSPSDGAVMAKTLVPEMYLALHEFLAGTPVAYMQTTKAINVSQLAEELGVGVPLVVHGNEEAEHVKTLSSGAVGQAQLVAVVNAHVAIFDSSHTNLRSALMIKALTAIDDNLVLLARQKPSSMAVQASQTWDVVQVLVKQQTLLLRLLTNKTDVPDGT